MTTLYIIHNCDSCNQLQLLPPSLSLSLSGSSSKFTCQQLTSHNHRNTLSCHCPATILTPTSPIRALTRGVLLPLLSVKTQLKQHTLNLLLATSQLNHKLYLVLLLPLKQKTSVAKLAFSSSQLSDDLFASIDPLSQSSAQTAPSYDKHIIFTATEQQH